MILFYIRHGDPVYDPDSLTPLGERQAEALAKRLALYGIDEVYASTSVRATQTALPLCELLKLEPKPLEWMHESLMMKEMELPVDETRHTWLWAHPVYAPILTSREVRNMGECWYEHPSFREFPLKQSLCRIGTAMDAWLATLGYEHDREKGLYRVTTKTHPLKSVALFAHEGVGKVFMSELLDIPFPYYATHFEMKHSGLTAIVFDEGIKYHVDGYARARVLTLSNDSHLYRDGLPTKHVSTDLRELY